LFSVLLICFDLKSRARIFSWPGLDHRLTLGLGGERRIIKLDPKERGHLRSSKKKKKNFVWFTLLKVRKHAGKLQKKKYLLSHHINPQGSCPITYLFNE